MACEACTDRTFRLRVTCTPCTGVTLCDCATLPPSLCLTLTGVTLSSPASSCSSALNGKKILLTYVPDALVSCCNPFASSYLFPQAAYTGSFSVRVGYYSLTYSVVLYCCGSNWKLLIQSTGGTTIGSPNSQNVTCVSSCFCVASAGFNDVSPCGNFSNGRELTVTCGPPFAATGYVEVLDALFASVGFMGVSISSTLDGCGADDTCCSSELGTHPNLSVVVTTTSGSYCFPELPNGAYTAVWNATESQWIFTSSVGGITYVWKLQCPWSGNNSWGITGWNASTGTLIRTQTGVGGCDPFYAIFSVASSGVPGGCNITVSL